MELYKCLRCHTAFDTQVLYEEHTRSPEQCIQVQQNVVYTFGKEVEKGLKRKFTRGTPEEDKWAEVYQAIFRGEEDVPSPYYDELPLAEYRAYARENYRQLLFEKLCAASTQSSLFCGLSDPMKEEMARIFCQCNDSMIQQFQQNQQLEASLDETAMTRTDDQSTNVSSLNTPNTNSGEVENTETQCWDSVVDWNPEPAPPPIMESMNPSPNLLGSAGNNSPVSDSTWMDHNVGLQPPLTQDWEPGWGPTGSSAALGSTWPNDASYTQVQPSTNDTAVYGQNWTQRPWAGTPDIQAFPGNTFDGSFC